MLHPNPPNSNGVDLSRRRVDVLTSIDDDDDEENEDDVKSEFHRLHSANDQVCLTLLYSRYRS